MNTLSPNRASAERRRSLRSACRLETCCHLITHASSDDRWPAVMLDISTGGLALSIERRFERGALLVVELQDDVERPVGIFHCRVVRVTPQEGGSWTLGCVLASPLTSQDIESLVESSTDQVTVGPTSYIPRSLAEARSLLRKG